MADIFLSYASEDRAQIEPLVTQLEGAGYSVWWDQDLKGGTRFSKRIETELTQAKVVIVAWSPHFDLNAGCAGALLSWYARRHLDKPASAALYLSKVEQVLKAAREDPDGLSIGADFMELSLTVSRGELDRAIEIIEAFFDRSMWNADSLLAALWLEPLFDDPRFVILKKRVDDHMARENQKCKDTGLINQVEKVLAAQA